MSATKTNGFVAPDGSAFDFMDYRIPTPGSGDEGKVPMYVGSTYFQWTKHVSAAEATATASTESYAASQGYGELSATLADVNPHGLIKVLYSYTPSQSFAVRFANDGSTYRYIKYRGAWLNPNDTGIICNGDTALLWYDGTVLHLITVDRRDRGDEMLEDGAYYPNAVQDRNGNWYGAVVIGKQVWLAENLKTRNRSNWTQIPVGGSTASDSTPYCYYPNNQSYRVEEYGLLYNWAAAMDGGSASSQNPSGVQGLAPDGWHIPSEAEFDQLVDYVARKPEFLADMTTSNAVAKSLASRSGWSTSSNTNAVGNSQLRNNKTMFGAKPAGTFNYEGSTQSFGASTIFWTTTQDSSQAKGKYINNANATVVTGSFNKGNGFAIRCVCDLSPYEFRSWYVTQYGSLQHHVQERNKTYYGYCTYNDTLQGGVISMLSDDFNIRIEEALLVLNFDYDFDESTEEFLYFTTDGSSYSRIYISPLSGHNIPEHGIQARDTCIFQYMGGYLKLLCVDRLVFEVLAKQDVLVGSGNDQNIKTINGNSLPGTGNIELGKGILTGVASSLSGTTAQVTLNQSGADLEHGVFLFVQFNVDMPALGRLNVANTVILGSDIIWKNATLPAGAIKTGDLCLFYYAYAGGVNMSFLLYNSRWASLKTINGNSLSGVGDLLTFGGTYHVASNGDTSYEMPIPSSTPRIKLLIDNTGNSSSLSVAPTNAALAAAGITKIYSSVSNYSIVAAGKRIIYDISVFTSGNEKVMYIEYLTPTLMWSST